MFATPRTHRALGPRGRTRPKLARRAAALVVVAGSLASLPGCSSSDPFSEQGEGELRRAVVQAAAREIAEAQRTGQPVTLSPPDSRETLGLSQGVLDEVLAMAGPSSYDLSETPVGPDLRGQEARTVVVALDRAVRAAAVNNVAVQFARLSPAISEAQVLAAEAAFDWTLFANLTTTLTDAPRVQTSLGSTPSFAGTPSTTSQDAVTSSVGLRRTLIGGGRLTIQQDLSSTDNSTRFETTRPDPARQLSYTLQYDQPLLRNLGSEVTLAEVRLARNAERNAVQTLKRDLMRTAADAERTYWELARAHRDLAIQLRLLERGENVRKRMELRLLNDANSAQVADARARVERRRSDVLRAQTNLKNASDRLKALMNDPELPVGSELILLPADQPEVGSVRFSLADCIQSAVQGRPEVQQAILGIDDASIRRLVADNARRPDLSLRLQARLSALDDGFDDVAKDVWDGSFIDYIAGLVYEQPLGNRRAEADLRRRNLERMQTVIAYRNTVQQVTQEVKAALDRLVLNHKLVEQTRVGRLAAANALRVLIIESETTAAITPERLDLELSRQEQLAAAEREEAQAQSDYHVALGDLYLAMGTLLERNRIGLVVPSPADAPWRRGPNP